MRIKKTIFSTEIDISPREMKEIFDILPKSVFNGLFVWMKKHLDFKLVMSNESAKKENT